MEELASTSGAPRQIEEQKGSYFSIYWVLLPLVSNPSLSFSYDTLPWVLGTLTREPPVPMYFYLSTCLHMYLPTKCRADNKIKSCHVPVADEAIPNYCILHPPGGSPAQIWLASVRFLSGSPFLARSQCVRKGASISGLSKVPH